MKAQMTHKERILATINHQPTDRIATDYWGVPEVTEKLIKHFGCENMYGLAKALDLDYIVEVFPRLKTERKNMWDIEYREIPIDGGLAHYSEPIAYPIDKYETIEEIDANYIWPTTDMYDYSTIKVQCDTAEKGGYAIMGGYISLTYFYEMIRGTEQMFIDMMMEPELASHVLFRLNEFASAHVERIFEAANGRIDMSQVTDDLGSQSGLLMSLDMVDNYLGKYYDENIKRIKSFGAKVFHHDDGAMTDAIPWLLNKGIDILNPLQWHLPKWDLNTLKKDYGERLAFHGGIDNQKVLPFGTVADVKKEVEICMQRLYCDRTGYILAPCHNLQAITPIENIIAMYDAARELSK